MMFVRGYVIPNAIGVACLVLVLTPLPSWAVDSAESLLEIANHGWTVSFTRRGEEQLVERMALRCSTIPASRLDLLRSDSSLRHLSIEAVDFDNRILGVVSTCCPALQSLELKGPAIQPSWQSQSISQASPLILEGLDAFGELRELRSLSLENTVCPKSSELKALSNLASLQSLSISGQLRNRLMFLPVMPLLRLEVGTDGRGDGGFTDQDLAIVNHFGTLRSLTISGHWRDPIVPIDFDKLDRLSELRTLVLGFCRFDPAQLRVFGKLDELCLRSCELDHGSLCDIAQLKSLRTLHLVDCSSGALGHRTLDVLNDSPVEKLTLHWPCEEILRSLGNVRLDVSLELGCVNSCTAGGLSSVRMPSPRTNLDGQLAPSLAAQLMQVQYLREVKVNGGMCLRVDRKVLRQLLRHPFLENISLEQFRFKGEDGGLSGPLGRNLRSITLISSDSLPTEIWQDISTVNHLDSLGLVVSGWKHGDTSSFVSDGGVKELRFSCSSEYDEWDFPRELIGANTDSVTLEYCDLKRLKSPLLFHDAHNLRRCFFVDCLHFTPTIESACRSRRMDRIEIADTDISAIDMSQIKADTVVLRGVGRGLSKRSP